MVEPTSKSGSSSNSEELKDQMPSQTWSSDSDDSEDFADFHEEVKSKLIGELGGSDKQNDNIDPKQYKAAIEKIRLNKVNMALDMGSKRIEDEYYKGEKIGEGAFGKVYKVTHYHSHVKRAVKQIKKGDFIDLMKKKREIEALLKLDHPNLVRLIDKFEDTKRIYLVQEYLKGETLFERIKARTSFDEDYCRQIFSQILEGINYIHKHNVSHRDIKPENFVFVSKDSDLLKMIDFGLSQNFTLYTMSQKKLMKRMETPVGTAWYTAPEVHEKLYTEKCDIWSAGVMLYIMLAGFPPFYGDDEIEIKREIMKYNYDFKDEAWDFISNEARDLIKQMLSPEYTRPTASECLQHKWFFMESKTENEFSTKALLRLREFSSLNKFKQIIYYLIAYRCNLYEQIQSYHNLFSTIDKNKHGFITKQELIQNLKSRVLHQGLLNKIVDAIDIDKNDVIYWNEFISSLITVEIIYNHENLKEVYYYFDLDKKGYFDSNDLDIALKKIQRESMVEGSSKDMLEETFKKQQITLDDLEELIYQKKGKKK
ncbi:protein kinase [Stylonychia lemnae]|uniref:non-specific serine/threonine protein kinase n=1 Tax=Stylonychia lemnae TaxID=5949 RepID=A0A078A3N7_STYLE|nr:protein kinase [Stylonychia lemnae]|eukprot:CDW76792.1 protein kinase [Stylonychia lemnae]